MADSEISFSEESVMEVSNLFVCLMGMGVTFIGLIALIFMTSIMGAICRRSESSQAKAPQAPAVIPPAADAIPNRGELIAAVSAALAEELGTDVAAIRILSFKKVG